MGVFDRLKEPVFLKENSNAEEQIEKLKALEPLLNPEGQAIIRQDIKCLEYGIAGEKNIAFELKNSHMPMSFYGIMITFNTSIITIAYMDKLAKKCWELFHQGGCNQPFRFICLLFVKERSYDEIIQRIFIICVVHYRIIMWMHC